MPTRGTGRRTLAAPALLLALATGLAGCTGGGTAEPTPTASAAVTPSPTPTPTPSPEPPKPPTRPEAMATPSADGAAAAASYFLGELYPYTYESTDLAPWNELSADTCEFCTAVRDDVTQLVRTGATSDQGAVTIDSAFGTEVAPGTWYRAELRFTQERSVRTDMNGVVLGESERSVADALVVLTWADGWKVDAVDVSTVTG